MVNAARFSFEDYQGKLQSNLGQFAVPSNGILPDLADRTDSPEGPHVLTG